MRVSKWQAATVKIEHLMGVMGVVCLLFPLGCSHQGAGANSISPARPMTSWSHNPHPSVETPDSDQENVAPSEAVLPLLDVPKTKNEAKDMLDRGFWSLQQQHSKDAAAAFRSVLASDFLTDRGRMNLYWMAAQAHEDFRDSHGEADALEGFLLAAEVLGAEHAGSHRLLWARARLAAMRVQEGGEYGRSPQKAIQVEDLREPAKIMAAMDCAQGEGHFRSVAIRSVNAGHNQLIHRTVACEQEEMDLWFNVTYVQTLNETPQP